MKLIKRLLIIIALAGLLTGFLLNTNPDNLSLAVLLVPFILLGAIIYNLCQLIMAIFRYGNSNPLRRRILALIIAILITNLAILQSIGRLAVQDVLFGLAITAIIIFYISRIHKPTS